MFFRKELFNVGNEMCLIENNSNLRDYKYSRTSTEDQTKTGIIFYIWYMGEDSETV